MSIAKYMNNPFIIVIFGATGDLTRAKLLPSLFNLFKKGMLPKDFYIYGFARRDLKNEEFHALFPKLMVEDHWSDFVKHLFYQQGNFSELQGYQELIEKLSLIEKKDGIETPKIFYLATPPVHYEEILSKLEETKLSNRTSSRIAIEKPFGNDLATAKHLDGRLSDIFEEQQIFRVDHYLGKENVQNMLAFRFANGIFEPVWNNKFIDHIQVTMSEKNGIGTRGKFFDGVGNLRDVAQNHLLQLVAAVTMEQPKSFTKEDVRDARAKAISAIVPISSESIGASVVRAQYDTYRKEKDVKSDSDTETFVALKFEMDTPRMKGVPIYLRAGKKMNRDVVEISIVFIQTCHVLFKEYGCPEIGNVITIRIQPDEGIKMRFIAKTPGSKLSLAPVEMSFDYEHGFGKKGLDAYEKVLEDILHGDQMLFNRSDELQSSWEFITNILHEWSPSNAPLYSYEDNSIGPKAADDLIENDGRHWL
jgi:glucose-6-phosphate 1-dehydrogenase